MKLLPLLLLASTAFAAPSERPAYRAMSPEVQGAYRSQHTQAVVHNGFVSLPDYGVEVALQETASGALVFTTGDLDGECDNPGCSILRKITGVLYPQRRGNEWLPTLKIRITQDYPYPEEAGAPEGEQTETEYLLPAN